VVTSLHIAVQAFTEPQDKILIQTPVYPPFYNVIEAHDREVIKNPLVNKDNYYTIDFADFENKLKLGVKAFILCSPHNPVGRVWRQDELEEMARLCLKYDVIILSDEIHADLVFPGQKHIPIASLSEEVANHTITCMAPSKTFNLAGLDASYVITTNTENRKKL
ncbi:aminotransferase class I/II-fold pyridoxal phosphate-dependent enzyme, partial [Staphylococcus sp. SIMBA_130]